MRAGLWALSTVLPGGITGSGGSGSACAYMLPVTQPQLPAGHPGGLLPGRRYGFCGLRLTTAHLCRLQLQLQYQWVLARSRLGQSCWRLAAERKEIFAINYRPDISTHLYRLLQTKDFVGKWKMSVKFAMWKMLSLIWVGRLGQPMTQSVSVWCVGNETLTHCALLHLRMNRQLWFYHS